MKNKHFIVKAAGQVSGEHPMLAVLLIVSILAAASAGLVPPLIISSIVDSLEKGKAGMTLPAEYFGVTLLVCGLNVLRETLITVFGQKITHSLRNQMFRKMDRLEADYYLKTQPGAVSSRIVNDIDTVQALFTSGVISMFSDLINILGILGVVFIKSKGLFCILLAALPLLFCLTRVFQKRMLRAQLDNRKAVAASSRQIPETIENIRSIVQYGGAPYMEQKYDQSIENGYNAVNRSNFYDAVYSPIILSVSSLIIAVMMTLCVSGENFSAWFGMTVGTAVALISYVGKVFEPLESLGMEIQNIQEAAAGLKRLDEFMAEPERRISVSVPEKAAEKTEQGEVEYTKKGENAQDSVWGSEYAIDIRNLYFGYDPHQPILKNFCMQIKKGEFITVAGRTGAGKSTLFRLILGLYRPDSGEVLIGGMKAEDIPDTFRRRWISCVPQQFSLIPGTVRDQVTLRDPSISDKMTEDALRQTNLWEMVSSLPQGLGTACSEKLFSQGQLQLLSIARAIVLNPEILLLDEITADLDSQTEKVIIETLKKASAGRTTISISHRLNMDAGGRIVRIGED